MPAAERGWRLSTIRGRLMLLAVALLTPAVVLAGVLLWNVDRQARRALEAQTTETARALSLVVDRHIGQHAALVEALATMPSLKAGDWTAFHTQAREAVHDRQVWVVVSEDGQQLVNTHLEADATLPVFRGPVDGFAWAGAKGRVRISNLYVNPVAGSPTVVVQEPVTLNDGRQVTLNIVTQAGQFDRVFLDQNLPESWTGSLLDSTGALIARSRDSKRLIGRLASVDMRNALTHSASGVVKTHTLDGIATYSAYNRLPGYGWAVIVGVPRAEMAGAARDAFAWGLVLAVALLGGGVAAAASVGRSVARPVEALAAAARASGDERRVSVPPSGMAEVDDLAAAFEARDAHQRLLINELNHRVKNTLAAVQSIAHQTLKGDDATREARNLLTARVLALSAAHNVLTRENWGGAGLREIIAEAVRPYDAAPPASRIKLDGPVVRLEPRAALALSMAVHELATNAAKYGALSNQDGTVTVSWRLRGDALTLEWRERGGPPVAEPGHKGFGSRLLQQGLTAELGGSAKLKFDSDGLVCTIRADLKTPVEA